MAKTHVDGLLRTVPLFSRCWRSSNFAFCDHRMSRSRINESRGLGSLVFAVGGVGALRGVRLATTSLGELGDGDGFRAARAFGADAGGSHEGVTVGAVLLAQGAAVAAVADVDGHGPFGTSGWDGRLGRGGLMAGPPGGDPTVVGAVAAPPGGRVAVSAHRAGRYRYAIVTRRDVSHGGLPCCWWGCRRGGGWGRRRGGGWPRPGRGVRACARRGRGC
jgi:hypothetical protein